jgi:hypothetical protein
MVDRSVRVRVVPVPVHSEVLTSLKRIDFADAYEAPLSRPQMGVCDAYWAVFGVEPIWVCWLMSLRGHIAIRLGLTHPFDTVKASPGLVPTFQLGMRVGPFTVQYASPNELIVGDDDKHLNFRISCLKTMSGERAFITISTVVEIHNKLGRFYMFVVKPFHRFIAPFMVRRAVNNCRL